MSFYEKVIKTYVKIVLETNKRDLEFERIYGIRLTKGNITKIKKFIDDDEMKFFIREQRKEDGNNFADDEENEGEYVNEGEDENILCSPPPEIKEYVEESEDESIPQEINDESIPQEINESENKSSAPKANNIFDIFESDNCDYFIFNDCEFSESTTFYNTNW